MGAESAGLTSEGSGGAESSAFSGKGGGSSSGEAFLGSCLKKRKRDCRSLRSPDVFNTVLSSSLHLLPSCKTANYHQPRLEKEEKKKKANLILLSHPPFPLTLPSSLARSPSLPSLSGGSRSSLGRSLSLPRDLATSRLFLSPFSIFLPSPFDMNWTDRRRGGFAFCPWEWRFASWGRAGEDPPRRKKE